MVKEMCLKCGLTLEEMAERSGYTPGFVSQLENNKASPSITTLYSITDALGVNVIDFFPQGIDPTKVTRHDSRESFHFKGSAVVFSLLSTKFHHGAIGVFYPVILLTKLYRRMSIACIWAKSLSTFWMTSCVCGLVVAITIFILEIVLISYQPPSLVWRT